MGAPMGLRCSTLILAHMVVVCAAGRALLALAKTTLATLAPGRAQLAPTHVSHKSHGPRPDRAFSLFLHFPLSFSLRLCDFSALHLFGLRLCERAESTRAERVPRHKSR